MWVANGWCKRVSDLLCTVPCIGQPASCRPSPKSEPEQVRPLQDRADLTEMYERGPVYDRALPSLSLLVDFCVFTRRRADAGGHLCDLRYKTCNHREVDSIRSDLAVGSALPRAAPLPATVYRPFYCCIIYQLLMVMLFYYSN